MRVLITALFAVFCLFATDAAHAAVKGKTITYNAGGVELTGYLAYDDAKSGKRPGVLVVHEWWGHNPYARKRADMPSRTGAGPPCADTGSRLR